MNTIRHFEHALGPQYSGHLDTTKMRRPGSAINTLNVFYPHALRAANTYYSPAKKALLFGYFSGPSGMVFSCLSHDIVAHETTHSEGHSLTWPLCLYPTLPKSKGSGQSELCRELHVQRSGIVVGFAPRIFCCRMLCTQSLFLSAHINCASIPPSTTKPLLLIKDEAPERRKAMTAATSSGCPTRGTTSGLNDKPKASGPP